MKIYVFVISCRITYVYFIIIMIIIYNEKNYCTKECADNVRMSAVRATRGLK